jgi:hypothetical protein
MDVLFNGGDMSNENVKPEENPKSKGIDELNEEDLKAVAGGATIEENTAAQTNTLNKSKVAQKGQGAIDTFNAM